MSEQSERMMVASDPLLAFDSGDGVCPFCAEGEFDLVGLKGHLLRGWCDKFNKIGLDVALEALRDCWRKRRATMDEIWKYATICRVAKVMRPYLESLV